MYGSVHNQGKSVGNPLQAALIVEMPPNWLTSLQQPDILTQTVLRWGQPGGFENADFSVTERH